jgi:hypothetical protein
MRKILFGTILAIAAIFITAGSGLDSGGNKLVSELDAPKAQQNQPAIDFLFASGATGDKDSPVVSFTDKTDKGGADNSFHHRMSLIKFTFKPGDGLIFNGMEPADYTLDGLKHEGTFDTATGTTAVTAAVESPITMQLGGATTSQVIILPQGVTTSLDLTVSFNGLDYTTTLPNPSKTVLTGSKFTIAKACSGKAGDEMVSRANIRMVKANKTTSKNAANIT